MKSCLGVLCCLLPCCIFAASLAEPQTVLPPSFTRTFAENDVAAVFDRISKLKSGLGLTQGEFTSSAEMKVNAKKAAAALNSSAGYVFMLRERPNEERSHWARYDADRKELVIHEYFLDRNPVARYYMLFAEREVTRDTYPATSALGIPVQVSRVVTLHYGLVFSSLPASVRSRVRHTDLGQEFSLALPMGAADAQALRPHLALVFVVDVEPPFISENASRIEPKTTAPYDMTMRLLAIHCRLRSLVLVDLRSGTVLAR